MCKKWLVGVMKRKYWCLHYDDASPAKPCASPPSKKDLAAIASHLLNEKASNDPEHGEAYAATAQFVLEKPPCQRWLLAVICHLDPDHEIFGRQYVRPKRQTTQVAIDEKVIDDPYGVLKDMPAHLLKGRRRATLNLMDPEEKNRIKLERKLQIAQKKVQEYEDYKLQLE